MQTLPRKPVAVFPKAKRFLEPTATHNEQSSNVVQKLVVTDDKLQAASCASVKAGQPSLRQTGGAAGAVNTAGHISDSTDVAAQPAVDATAFGVGTALTKAAADSAASRRRRTASASAAKIQHDDSIDLAYKHVRPKAVCVSFGGPSVGAEIKQLLKQRQASCKEQAAAGGGRVNQAERLQLLSSVQQCNRGAHNQHDGTAGVLHTQQQMQAAIPPDHPSHSQDQVQQVDTGSNLTACAGEIVDGDDHVASGSWMSQVANIDDILDERQHQLQQPDQQQHQQYQQRHEQQHAEQHEQQQSKQPNQQQQQQHEQQQQQQHAEQLTNADKGVANRHAAFGSSSPQRLRLNHHEMPLSGFSLMPGPGSYDVHVTKLSYKRSSRAVGFSTPPKTSSASPSRPGNSSSRSGCSSTDRTTAAGASRQEHAVTQQSPGMTAAAVLSWHSADVALGQNLVKPRSRSAIIMPPPDKTSAATALTTTSSSTAQGHTVSSVDQSKAYQVMLTVKFDLVEPRVKGGQVMHQPLQVKHTATSLDHADPASSSTIHSDGDCQPVRSVLHALSTVM